MYLLPKSSDKWRVDYNFNHSLKFLANKYTKEYMFRCDAEVNVLIKSGFNNNYLLNFRLFELKDS
ncbi:MAG: putative transposase [Flavobacteriales bacterium]|jgi:putative transposase